MPPPNAFNTAYILCITSVFVYTEDSSNNIVCVFSIVDTLNPDKI